MLGTFRKIRGHYSSYKEQNQGAEIVCLQQDVHHRLPYIKMDVVGRHGGLTLDVDNSPVIIFHLNVTYGISFGELWRSLWSCVNPQNSGLRMYSV